jgi:hypothetical protein
VPEKESRVKEQQDPQEVEEDIWHNLADESMVGW